MIDTFQDYQDVWQDSQDIWYRGLTDDALRGCVLVNPRLSGNLTVVELLKGILTVKPHE